MCSIIEMLMGMMGKGGGSGVGSSSDSFGVMKSDQNSGGGMMGGMMDQLAGSQMGSTQSKPGGGTMGSVGAQSHNPVPFYGDVHPQEQMSMLSALSNMQQQPNQMQPRWGGNTMMSLMQALRQGR